MGQFTDASNISELFGTEASELEFKSENVESFLKRSSEECSHDDIAFAFMVVHVDAIVDTNQNYHQV